MSRPFGTSVGPSWADVLAVLEDFYRTYGVVVTLRVFPLVGCDRLGSFGVQFQAHDCYGVHIGSRISSYAVWPSNRFQTFTAMCYFDALSCREWVIDCATNVASTRTYPATTAA